MLTPPALRALVPALIAAAVIIALDQASKHIVVERMNLRDLGEIAAGPILTFRMAWNTGVNFGLLGGDSDVTRYILIAIQTLASLGFLIGAMWTGRPLHAIGLGVAAGGALGNMIDRWTYGAVADFINVSCCGIDNPWSFNVADIAIFAGLAVLLLPSRAAAKPEAA